MNKDEKRQWLKANWYRMTKKMRVEALKKYWGVWKEFDAADFAKKLFNPQQ